MNSVLDHHRFRRVGHTCNRAIGVPVGKGRQQAVPPNNGGFSADYFVAAGEKYADNEV